MTDREHIQALLSDLADSLDALEDSDDGRLKRIAHFTTCAVHLRAEVDVEDREWLQDELHTLGSQHGVPDDCVLPQ